MSMRPSQRTILTSELDNLKARIIQNHIAAGQRASGKTIAVFETKMLDNEGQLLGRKAVGTLETGRKGGKVPKGFATIILKWMQAKGINVERPKSFAYFVAQKIAREGTALHRSGGRTDIYSNEIPRTIEQVVNRLGKDMVTEFENIVINKIKEYA